jgi:mercuric transport protein
MIPSNWSLSAALTAAGLSAACCTLPLALVSLGVGGAWMGSLTALAPYRWIFVTLAVGALAYAGYNEWRLQRQPDCECKTVFSSTSRRMMLGLGAFAVLTVIVSPLIIAPSPSAENQQGPVTAIGEEQAGDASTPSSVRQVVLRVDGMTCASCRTAVRTALEDVDGVHRATVTYEPPQAVVRFDPQTTSVRALTQATDRAGYPSHLKSP